MMADRTGTAPPSLLANASVGLPVRISTAPPGLPANASGRFPALCNVGLGTTAPPTMYGHDPEAHDLSAQIFDKLDANRTGYLESPHELHRAFEVMLGMYCSVTKPLEGGAMTKSPDLAQLAQTLSTMLSKLDIQDSHLSFTEWDTFFRSIYKASGRHRYISIASHWAEYLAREAPHGDRHPGNLNLLSRTWAGPDTPRLGGSRQRQVCDESLPQLLSSRGRPEASASLAEVGCSTLHPPLSPKSPPKRKSISPARRFRPVLDRGRVDLMPHASPSACSSRHSDFFCVEQPPTRSVSIPGKVARAVAPLSAAPWQPRQSSSDWAVCSTFPRSADRRSHTSPSSQSKGRSGRPWGTILESHVSCTDEKTQQQLQSTDTGTLLRRDLAMMMAMDTLRKSERVIRHGEVLQRQKPRADAGSENAALKVGSEDQQNQPDIIVVSEERCTRRSSIVKREAAVKLQAHFRGMQARKVNRLKLGQKHVSRRALLQEQVDLASNLKQLPEKHASLEMLSPRSRTNIAYTSSHDDAFMQVQLNMTQVRSCPPIRKKKHRSDSKGNSSRFGLPALSFDDLWDIVTGLDGNIKAHLEVREMLDIFVQCRQSGLDLTLARTIPQEHLELVDPAVEPEDISPGEVCHLCMLMIHQPEYEMGESFIRKEVNAVKDECRRTAYRDIVLPRDAYLSLVLFRRLIHYISILMQIEEAYIISCVYWHTKGHFEMTDTLAAMMMERCAGKRVHGAKNITGVTEDHHHCDVEDDTLLLLDERFTASDFSRLCYSCHVVDPREKVGIPFSKINAIFSQTAKAMEKLVGERVQERPKLKKSWAATKREAHNADANAHHLAVSHSFSLGLESPMAKHSSGNEGRASPRPSISRCASPAPPSQGNTAGHHHDTHHSRGHHSTHHHERYHSGGHHPTHHHERYHSGGHHPTHHQDPHHKIRSAGGDIIVGRTEFSILMEATYKSMPCNIYSSPMQMCIDFLQACSKGSLSGH